MSENREQFKKELTERMGAFAACGQHPEAVLVLIEVLSNHIMGAGKLNGRIPFADSGYLLINTFRDLIRDNGPEGEILADLNAEKIVRDLRSAMRSLGRELATGLPGFKEAEERYSLPLEKLWERN